MNGMTSKGCRIRFFCGAGVDAMPAIPVLIVSREHQAEGPWERWMHGWVGFRREVRTDSGIAEYADAGAVSGAASRSRVVAAWMGVPAIRGPASTGERDFMRHDERRGRNYLDGKE